jgi:hypothetical protein
MSADKNLVRGTGKLYFNPFAVGTTNPTGEIYLAQSRELSYSLAAETLDHYDADAGMNVLDEQVQTKVDMTGKTSIEHISMENLAIFLQAAGVTTLTNTAGTGLTETFTVKRGRFYQLGATNANPVGARNVTVTAVAISGTPVANTNNVNYIANGPLGRLQIVADAPGIADDAVITVTYNVAAGTQTMVISKDQQIRGALRFVSDNPVGDQKDYFFPYVNMQPDGDYALKGEDWQTMGFNFTALKLGSLERVYVTAR